MLFVICALAGGAVFGVLAFKTAGIMIGQRVDKPVQSRLVTGKKAQVFWAVFFACCFTAGALLQHLKIGIFQTQGKVYAVEFFIMFSILVSISVVDLLIQKIPNQLLLALIVNKILFFIILFALGRGEAITKNIVGLIAGLMIFMLPSLFLKIIGMGDIKLAAVIGLCIGFTALLQTIFLMSFLMGLYTIYLYATKKGNLKTMAPMGPFLSLGAIITALFPLVGNIAF